MKSWNDGIMEEWKNGRMGKARNLKLYQNKMGPKIPLPPPFPKGENSKSPFVKGDFEGSC
jgi:hypothetical protein